MIASLFLLTKFVKWFHAQPGLARAGEQTVIERLLLNQRFEDISMGPRAVSPLSNCMTFTTYYLILVTRKLNKLRQERYNTNNRLEDYERTMFLHKNVDAAGMSSARVATKF